MGGSRGAEADRAHAPGRLDAAPESASVGFSARRGSAPSPRGSAGRVLRVRHEPDFTRAPPEADAGKRAGTEGRRGNGPEVAGRTSGRDGLRRRSRGRHPRRIRTARRPDRHFFLLGIVSGPRGVFRRHDRQHPAVPSRHADVDGQGGFLPRDPALRFGRRRGCGERPGGGIRPGIRVSARRRVHAGRGGAGRDPDASGALRRVTARRRSRSNGPISRRKCVPRDVS